MHKTFLCLLILLQCIVSHAQVDSLYEKVQSTDDAKTKVNLLIEISDNVQTNNPNDAKKYVKEGIQIAHKCGDKVVLSDIYYEASDIELELRSFTESLEYADTALEYAKLVNYDLGMANALSSMGAVKFYKGKYNEALVDFFAALDYYEKQSDEIGIARIFNSIGTLYHTWHKDSLALTYLNKSLKIFEEKDIKEGISICYTNIGNVYFENEDYEKTLFYNQKSLQMKQELNDKEGAAIGLNNIGNVYFKWEKYDQAFSYYIEALDLYNSIDDKIGKAMMYYNLGFVNEMNEAYDSALYYYTKSLDTSRAYDLNYKIMYTLEAFAEVYAAKEDYKKSLDYFRQYLGVKDSIFNDENHKQIAELEKRYETEKKDIEISQQKDQIQKQKIIIISFILGILLITTSAILLIRLNLQRKRAYKLLEDKNEEILQQKEEIQAQSEQLELTNHELEKLSIVASETDNAVIIADCNGEIEWVNAAFIRIYGYSFEEYKSKVGSSLFAVSSNNDVKELFNKCVSNKESVIYSSQCKTKDGNSLWIQTTLSPILGYKDEVVKLIAIDSDISELKLAEE
ncbi:MAG: hypothetical protein C0594_17530 [Marinilabiliales bacterium]|nr:MAG: hypothetical protein C0594_17530 [Marinilabiliales bacterium]